MTVFEIRCRTDHHVWSGGLFLDRDRAQDRADRLNGLLGREIDPDDDVDPDPVPDSDWAEACALDPVLAREPNLRQDQMEWDRFEAWVVPREVEE